MIWYRGSLWFGRLLSVCAFLIFLVSVQYNIRVVNLPNLFIDVRAGELHIGSELGTARRTGGLGGIQQATATPRLGPFHFRRARHGLGWWSGDVLAIGIRCPLWMVIASGIALTLLSKAILRWARYTRHECLRCGYDLRGTPSERCSECGHTVRCPRTLAIPWLQSSDRKALAVYVVISLLWSSCNAFSANGPSLWWVDADSPAGFVLQLCGPFAWILSPYWPILDATVGRIGEAAIATMFAVVLWTAWCVALRSTRLRNASLVLHAATALAWFCLGPLFVGICIWVFGR